MDRRGFLKTVGTGAAAVAGWPGVGAAAAPAARPNIVLIMTDDLGYGHLGCYGQRYIRTPHLDRLARGGVRFTDAYAGCAQCAPSRSVLMTGLHAGHTPVRGNSGGIPLRDEDVTLAEVLQLAGYRTGLFGKWGLGEAGTTGVPNRQGFDEFFGYLHQKHAHFYYTDYLWHNEERYPLRGNRDGQRTQYSHDVILEKALEFLSEQDDRPFFCFLSTTIPHHEWTVPEESLAEYAGQFEETPPKYRWREGYATPKQPKANMAAMITHMDKGVGKILDLLDARGLRENTLVMFVSDNGADSYSLACAEFFQANGPLRGYKYDLYEGGIRVPAIAAWPGRVPAGETNAQPWYFADLMPTFVALAGAGVKLPQRIDGMSIEPALVGGAPAADRFLYWETDGERAARLGRWKAVQSKNKPLELYDLENDVGERNNCVQAHPDIAARFLAYMDTQHEDPPPQIEPQAPDGRFYQ